MFLRSYSQFSQQRLILESQDPNDIDKFKSPKPKVYHRTKDSKVELIGRDGYRAGGGDVWGPGIYTVYDLISTTKKNPYNEGTTTKDTYGPVIIENEVQSMKNFLIFNYDVAKRVYKKEYRLQDQLKKILPEKTFIKYKREINSADEICERLLKANPINRYTADAWRILYQIPEIVHFLRGVVFCGEHDGKVLISYDRENILPVRYSLDDGKNWKKIKKQGAHQIAKRNLRGLLSKGDSQQISDFIEDHIKNQLTSDGYDNIEDYLEKNLNKEKNLSIDFKSIMPFSYILKLDEKEYPNLKEIKSKIGSIYEKITTKIIKYLETLSKSDKLEDHLSLLNWNGVQEFMSLLETESSKVDFDKIYFESLNKIIVLIKEESKSQKTTLDQELNLVSKLDKTFRAVEDFTYYRGRMTGSEKLTQTEIPSSEILKIIKELTDKNSSNIKLFEKLNEIYSAYEQHFKNIFSSTKFTQLTGQNFEDDDLKKLQEFSQQLDPILDSLISSGYKSQMERDSRELVIPIPNMQGQFGPNLCIDYFVLFLPKEIVEKFCKIGFIPQVENYSYTALWYFFDSYDEIPKRSTQKCSEYLEKKFDSCIKYVVDEVKDIRYWSSGINIDTELQIMYHKDIRDKVDEDKKINELARFLGDSKSSPDKQIEILKKLNIKITEDQFDKFLFLDQDKLNRLSENDLIEKGAKWSILAWKYLKQEIQNPSDSEEEKKLELSDEEKNIVEEKLKEDKLLEEFFKANSFRTSEDIEKLISKLPIDLFTIIKKGLISDYDSNRILKKKLIALIKSEDFEKVDKFLDTLIENKITNIGSIIEQVELKKIPTNIIIKLIDNKIINIYDYEFKSQDYKNDDVFNYFLKKNIYYPSIVSSPELIKKMADSILNQENFDARDFEDIIHLVDFEKHKDKIIKRINIEKDLENILFLFIILFVVIDDKEYLIQKIDKQQVDRIIKKLCETLSENNDLSEIDLFNPKSESFLKLQKSQPKMNIENYCKFFKSLLNRSEVKGTKMENLIQKYLKSYSTITEKKILSFSKFNHL